MQVLDVFTVVSLGVALGALGLLWRESARSSARVPKADYPLAAHEIPAEVREAARAASGAEDCDAWVTTCPVSGFSRAVALWPVGNVLRDETRRLQRVEGVWKATAAEALSSLIDAVHDYRVREALSRVPSNVFPFRRSVRS